MNLRLIIVIIVMTLCVLDLALTYFYITKYKAWQPNKSYKLIELNPLLRFMWEKFGIHLGMFIAAVIILALNYIVSKEAHWIVVTLLLGLLVFAIFNHIKNIGLLFKLIEMYPAGHLDPKIFGIVQGNNPMK